MEVLISERRSYSLRRRASNQFSVRQCTIYSKRQAYVNQNKQFICTKAAELHTSCMVRHWSPCPSLVSLNCEAVTMLRSSILGDGFITFIQSTYTDLIDQKSNFWVMYAITVQKTLAWIQSSWLPSNSTLRCIKPLLLSSIGPFYHKTSKFPLRKCIDS